METKQTAVEWLSSQLSLNDRARYNGMIEQAEEMEREQHKLTWERGSYSLLDHGSGEDFEDYYNKTYVTNAE